MPFTDIAPPPAPKPAGTGISFGMSINKAKQVKVRLTIREDLQLQLFGEAIAGKKMSAQVGRGSDEGLLRLILDESGDLEAKGGIKGSVYINMAGWDLLPKDKRPSAPCAVKSAPSNFEVILKLPAFCRPSGVGGKMEEEFGLKKTGVRK